MVALLCRVRLSPWMAEPRFPVRLWRSTAEPLYLDHHWLLTAAPLYLVRLWPSYYNKLRRTGTGERSWGSSSRPVLPLVIRDSIRLVHPSPPGSGMLSVTIWGLSSLLEAALTWRAFRTRLFQHFPVFVGYLVFVLAESALRFYFYRWDYGLYNTVFWSTEFLAFIVGGCVIFELYRQALRPYPGTAKMVRNVLLFLFALALARALNTFLSDPQMLQETSGIQVERALRTFQAIAIFSLVSLFFAYSIPFGRTLRGILLGYSLFIGERVICLAFVAETGKGFWFYAYSASYIAAVGVWLAHLWSPAPVPQEAATPRLERDYNLIAAATQQRLREARDYLRKMGGL